MNQNQPAQHVAPHEPKEATTTEQDPPSNYDAASVRPYFIPQDLDFDSLPREVQLAVQEFVQPVYDELVLGAADALTRSSGMSYVYLVFVELLEQFELSRQIADQVQQGASNPSPRDEDLQRHLRLIGAKGNTGEFLLRLRKFRAKYHDPFVGPAPG